MKKSTIRSTAAVLLIAAALLTSASCGKKDPEETTAPANKSSSPDSSISQTLRSVDGINKEKFDFMMTNQGYQTQSSGTETPVEGGEGQSGGEGAPVSGSDVSSYSKTDNSKKVSTEISYREFASEEEAKNWMDDVSINRSISESTLERSYTPGDGCGVFCELGNEDSISVYKVICYADNIGYEYTVRALDASVDPQTVYDEGDYILRQLGFLE